ncbi:Lpg1974 family pore-forming outer membrane protein [Anatilimnocola sp. NA78]|uniref:Lpg1974 family pore-forming outer membrane protein n=1 Tax=Anatilimnocola sp. NA78 TaxID=3415683 RepID=UPI003CE4FD31
MRINFLSVVATLCVALCVGSDLAMAQYGSPGMAQAGFYQGGDAPAPMGGGIPPAPGGSYGCGAGVGCSDGIGGYCGDGCGDCCDGWTHRFNVFGEFLYLRPRDVDVAYASAIDGPIVAGAPGLQNGRIGVLDQDYQPGFRVGVGFTTDSCNQITLSYSQLDATSTDAIAATGTNVIRGLVLHPNSVNAGANWLNANASGGLQYKMADLDYRGLLAYSNEYEVGYLVGARYTRLEQNFAANFVNVGTETVNSSVDFEGAGMRLGLDFERYGRNRQWFVYGKGYTSFIGGEFRGSYLQSNQGDPVVAQTTWEAGRIVSIMDLESGIGWQSCSGNIRLSIGYLYSGWYNVVKQNEFISAVQNNAFVANGMSTYDSAITFDGLTARVEVRW